MQITRKLSCPVCRYYGWHDSDIHPEREANTCRNCDHCWKIEYDAPSKLYEQLISTHIGYIQETISEVSRELEEHSWSIGMGARDRAALERVKLKVNHSLKLLNSFIGG